MAILFVHNYSQFELYSFYNWTQFVLYCMYGYLIIFWFNMSNVECYFRKKFYILLHNYMMFILIWLDLIIASLSYIFDTKFMLPLHVYVYLIVIDTISEMSLTAIVSLKPYCSYTIFYVNIIWCNCNIIKRMVFLNIILQQLASIWASTLVIWLYWNF